jgi:hypothetical protein
MTAKQFFKTIEVVPQRLVQPREQQKFSQAQKLNFEIISILSLDLSAELELLAEGKHISKKPYHHYFSKRVQANYSQLNLLALNMGKVSDLFQYYQQVVALFQALGKSLVTPLQELQTPQFGSIVYSLLCVDFFIHNATAVVGAHRLNQEAFAVLNKIKRQLTAAYTETCLAHSQQPKTWQNPHLKLFDEMKNFSIADFNTQLKLWT